jgi:hypothetical protein
MSTMGGTRVSLVPDSASAILLSNTMDKLNTAASVIQYAWRAHLVGMSTGGGKTDGASWRELTRRRVQAELILHLVFQVAPLKPFSPDRFAHVLDRRIAHCPENPEMHHTFIWKVQYQPDETITYFFHTDMVSTIEDAAAHDYQRQQLHACRLAIQQMVTHKLFAFFIQGEARSLCFSCGSAAEAVRPCTHAWTLWAWW